MRLLGPALKSYINARKHNPQEDYVSVIRKYSLSLASSPLTKSHKTLSKIAYKTPYRVSRNHKNTRGTGQVPKPYPIPMDPCFYVKNGHKSRTNDYSDRNVLHSGLLLSDTLIGPTFGPRLRLKKGSGADRDGRKVDLDPGVRV